MKFVFATLLAAVVMFNPAYARHTETRVYKISYLT